MVYTSQTSLLHGDRMHFDDRLATVLRHRATSERAANTQFRQLIDLLGERPQAGNPSLKAAAYLRLIALGEMIPVPVRAAIVGEAGWRFRNPDLVRWFGEAAPPVAAAALARAQLTGPEWHALIPQLPVRARGFLRHRRDLPDEAIRVLDRLGVLDRALPLPEPLELAAEFEELAGLPEPEPLLLASSDVAEPGEDIRALVARIEAFKRARGAPEGDAPRLPLDEPPPPFSRKPLAGFIFGTDTEGRIDWAEPEFAPLLVGMDLLARTNSLPRRAAGDFTAAFRNRQPVHEAPIELRGAPAIAGDWMVDAAPRFTRSDGRFFGYVGRLRRAVVDNESARHAEADRIRQLLHELRTPVNAIQGFAEVIQQQIFGPTPHEYRALAATIAGDAARMLAGFDELDRLARLESGALDLEPGTSDFAAIARAQVAQLQTVLSPRVARFEAQWSELPAPLALAQGEAEMLAWRVLATLAGATGAGEAVPLALDCTQGQIELRSTLPAALRQAEDIFNAETRPASGALSAGIFGAGFSLRLARAEARAAGGELSRVGDALVLSLPLLTAVEGLPSPAGIAGGAAG